MGSNQGSQEFVSKFCERQIHYNCILMTNNWQSSDRANIASDIDVVPTKS